MPDLCTIDVLIGVLMASQKSRPWRSSKTTDNKFARLPSGLYVPTQLNLIDLLRYAPTISLKVIRIVIKAHTKEMRDRFQSGFIRYTHLSQLMTHGTTV